MSSHDMKNPTGGVSMGHVIEPPDHNSNLLNFGLTFIIQLRADKLCETPGADPQAVVLWVEKLPLTRLGIIFAFF